MASTNNNSLSRIVLDGRNVIASGQAVIQYGNSMQIFPFEDDYAINVIISIVDKASIYVRATEENKRQCDLVLDISFQPFLNEISNREPINFAISDDSKTNYFINVYLKLIGARDSYTAIFLYTIFESEA